MADHSSEPWFFISFADASLPEGSQFLGGCYVQAASLRDAITKTHALGINPGGSGQAVEIAPEQLRTFEEHVLPEQRNRLLTRDEIEGQG